MEAERNYRKDTTLTLRFLQPLVDKYRILFESWMELIHRVTQKRLKGTKIMEIVYESIHTGIPEVKAAYSRYVSG
jgi:hypothetical protein